MDDELLKQYIVEAAKSIVSDFKVGDRVLMGKYKNQHGIIVKLDLDAKGHPFIEIEPVSKSGRKKKNKVMGLYKVWHDDTPTGE